MGPVRKEVFEDVPIDVEPDRYFKAWIEAPVLLAKLLTGSIHNSCCSEGNHQEEGGVVEMVYPSGKPFLTTEYTCGKDVYQQILVDYDNRVQKYQFKEGEIKDRCKFYKGTVEIVPAHSGKSILKHFVEFELLDGTDASFSSAQHEKATIDYAEGVEKYLKAHPSEYAI
eukprot:TRINITY_DN3547_c0_g1_i1.p1 TRINITY_DN3547_c0_g1~~TRINITY_DN3547_c0_g1_i1.p1  ORF type:complete len:169 (-),score=25.10 TRINITY_DN3547_c0_g1_i1:212-718(-)